MAATGEQQESLEEQEDGQQQLSISATGDDAPNTALLLPDLLNDEGAAVNFSLENDLRCGMLYCGRRLGIQVIPDSDGQCGPHNQGAHNGPNCPSCRRLQDNPSTRLRLLQRLFPRLVVAVTQQKADRADDQQTTTTTVNPTALFVGAMRCSSGRLQYAMERLEKEMGVKAITPSYALSARSTKAPDPPHLFLTGNVARQVQGLQDSLRVSMQVAEYALRMSRYDTNVAADFILNNRDTLQEELVNEAKERDEHTKVAQEWNMERQNKIQEFVAQTPRGIVGPCSSDCIAMDCCCSPVGDDNGPQPVKIVKGHRMVLARTDDDDESSSTACVLCSVPIPSPWGGRYRCQACRLCEGCVTTTSGNHHVDDKDKEEKLSNDGMVLRCPGPSNGGHVHPHPLVFTTERWHHECDIEGPGCISDPICWSCIQCDFDVCQVCISRPAPRGYNRRLQRIIAQYGVEPEDGGSGSGDNDEWDENHEIANFFAGLTGLFEDPRDDDDDDDAHQGPEFNPPMPPRGPSQQVITPETAERQAAGVWENNLQSSPISGEVRLGTGTVGAVELRPRGPDHDSQPTVTQPRPEGPFLPTEGLLSTQARGALDLYRSRSDASTVAAVDVTHVEDLLRRAQAADHRLTSRAICDAIAAGRLGVAGTMLLSQAYAPTGRQEDNRGGQSSTPPNASVCWCGFPIDAKSSPDGAVGCLGGHAMHAACAADLLLGGGNCPTCRQPLFFSKVAGPEARAAIEFAKAEINEAQLREKENAQKEVAHLRERGVKMSFNVGDVVLVSPEVEFCRLAQSEDPIRGGWEDDMSAACGLEGLVTGFSEDDGEVVSVRVRSLGRHRYKKIMRVDDYFCPECSSDLLGHRCRNCQSCESCCRRTLRSCPENTHEWNWNPSVLSLLRRSGSMGIQHETVFGSEATATIGMAERHILRLRGELVAVKKAREAVKQETDKFVSAIGRPRTKISRELSAGSSAAVHEMTKSGVSPYDWQRARHLLLLARQWGDTDEAKAERAALYSHVRKGELEAVARRVRGYNAARTEDSARWADATETNAEYSVESFARVDLRAFPDIAAPKTGYTLGPLCHFRSRREVLDKSGRLWIQVTVPSLDDLNSLDGKPVTRELAWLGAPVKRGPDWTFGSQDGGHHGGRPGRGVITRLTETEAYVRWHVWQGRTDHNSTFRYALSTDTGPTLLLFAGSLPSAPPQGWVCVRPDAGSRPLVVRTESKLRCFGCGDKLIPSRPEDYESVKGKSVKKGDRLLVAATLESVTVEVSKAGYILCLFALSQDTSPSTTGLSKDAGIDELVDSCPEDFGIWYRPEDLVFPCSGDEGASLDVTNDETVSIRGQQRTRCELYIASGHNEDAARKLWNEAKKKSDMTDSTTFASCSRGHLLHARCFQAALLDGHRCPAAGCREPLWAPSVTRERDDNDDTHCGGASRGTLDETEALQVSSELAGHAAIVAVRRAEAEGEQHRDAGFNSLKMCPLCCAGPLFNNECSDMMAHHGQCSVMALRQGQDHIEDCTPDGDFRAPASEIAARVAQISETRTVADVLPKCKKHNALVVFNGCMACGHLFTDTSWNDMPKWDPSAKALLESDRKKRNAARLLTEQVRTEAALLQFERDALWEAGGFEVGVDAGWGGSGLDPTPLEPPPVPPPPWLPPSAHDSSDGDY